MSYRKLKLGDISSVQTGPFGSQLHMRDYKSEGIPIITVEHLGENRISHEKIPLISEEDANRLSKYTLQYGDIVFSRVGSVDRRAFVRETEENWLFSGRCLRVRVKNRDVIDPKYLSYYFGLETFKQYIRGIAVGATMPSLNTKIMSDLEVDVPSVDKQKKISNLLDAIDDKIENNNRMNKNLEQMAQAIFKQWFVEFEFPDENGGPYKSSGGEMVWCEELGKEIPKGWEVGPVSKIIDINPKRTLKKGTETIYVEMKSIPTFEARISTWINREFTSGTKFVNGDVLLARITPCLENGKTAFVDILSENQVGWGSTEFIVLRSRNEEALEYAYILTRSDEFRDHAIKNMTGSSGRQRVPESCFENLILALPPNELITQYGKIITPFFKEMKNNGESNKILSKLRDTLLPKLMSGEIDVSNIEL